MIIPLSIYVMKGHGAIAISRTGAAAQQTRHRLSELLTIAVCAALSGADGFEVIASGRAPAAPTPAKTGPSARRARKFIWPSIRWAICLPALSTASPLEVVKLPEAKRGFVLLPRRWVVERSFGWAARFRRLARDYERLPETLAGLHYLAFACLRLPHLTEAMNIVQNML